MPGSLLPPSTAPDAAGSASVSFILSGTNTGNDGKPIDATLIVDATGTPISSFGGGTQYIDGTTSVTPTGTAVLWLDATNLLHVPSPTNPLPVTTAPLTANYDSITVAAPAGGLATNPRVLSQQFDTIGIAPYYGGHRLGETVLNRPQKRNLFAGSFNNASVASANFQFTPPIMTDGYRSLVAVLYIFTDTGAAVATAATGLMMTVQIASTISGDGPIWSDHPTITNANQANAGNTYTASTANGGAATGPQVQASLALLSNIGIIARVGLKTTATWVAQASQYVNPRILVTLES